MPYSNLQYIRDARRALPISRAIQCRLCAGKIPSTMNFNKAEQAGALNGYKEALQILDPLTYPPLVIVKSN